MIKWFQFLFLLFTTSIKISFLLFLSFAKSKKPIIYNTNTRTITFGETSYPSDTLVKFNNQTFTMVQIWFALKHINDDFSVFLKQCKERGIEPLALPSRVSLKGQCNLDDTSSIFIETSEESSQKSNASSLLDSNLDDKNSKKRDFDGSSEQEKKKLKPFDHSIVIQSGNMEFGEKEKDSKQSLLLFLSNVLTSQVEDVNVDPFLPYLTYDRDQSIQYLNSKEIPFSTRISQTQVEKEYVERKQVTQQSQSRVVSHFTNCLDNTKRCKEHLIQHKKEEQKKRKEREKKEKTQGYNQENAKLNYDVKGRFDERNVWQSEFGNDDILNDFQINTTGSMMIKDSSTTNKSSTIRNTEETSTLSVIDASKQSTIPKPNGSSQSSSATPAKIKKPLRIILLPPGISSLITLYNVKDFLQKGNFITTEEKKKILDSNAPKPKEVIIKHAKSNEQFLVLDTTKNMQKKDWDRVVAIFTIGQLWQFKDSPNWFSTDPSIIFSKKKGFTLAFEGDALPPNVQNWAVEKLLISKLESKRHTDSTVSRKFWNAIGMD